ncbi:zinc-dependent alcohol dehydrogenase family protein [Thiolapillus brandeum]|uniref:NADPH2:quinone reductase n=1 Tax=Thiolapillus brandeum TaxID=1076588 RepID=A0A7U6GG68_9GAMM|nr:zinc-dependent alcohol dehydrogenase family protein [Thiolapillus brandeum]BAO43020.1 NADPH2:quinone reductase [Thiolapillus brandeum]
MKAVVMTDTGGPEVLDLQELPEPPISRPTQIKVRLHTAGINPIDTKLRARGLFYGATPPAILGCDGAGEVVAIGDEVTRFQPGDKVWFCHGGLGREQGNYAQFTVLDECRAEFMPARINFPEVGATPLALITAWEALYDRGRLEEGQTVLIHAGAGGVGHIAIQLAKIRGARVITTVSSAEKADFVRELGADIVVNYRTDDLEAIVMEHTEGRGVDLVFDTVGPETFRQSLPLIREYGSIVTILDPGEGLVTAEARNRNLSIAFTLMLTPALKDLREALAHQGEILRLGGEWMSEGRLKTHVSRILQLEEAPLAHRLIEDGHTLGKMVLMTG